jgi:hypothetical protein
MTSLDDALNSPAPVFAPPTLTVGWRERPDTEASKPGENLSDMSDMLEGSFEIAQSFDDALPDPVTMTNGNDAGGALTASLVGRMGLQLAGLPTTAMNFFHNTGSLTDGFIGLPTGLLPGDYVLAILTVPSGTVLASEDLDSDLNQKWTGIAAVRSSAFTLFVYGREAYSGMPAPTLHFDSAMSDAVWTSISFRATDAAGNRLPWNVKSIVTSTDGGSTTTHALPTVTTGNGYALSIWAGSQTLTWNYTGPGAEMGEAAYTTASLMVASSAYVSEPTSFTTLSATSSAATGTSVRVGLSIEPYQRPQMTPSQFWSPFNSGSPIYGFDRDTADVGMQFNTVTDIGVQGSQLFSGLMNDVSTKAGQAVDLAAVSKTRVNLNRSLNLPMVFARREGCTIDFLVTWLMARGNQFFGPAPGPWARYWAPMYGSVHAGLDAFNGYNYGMFWDTSAAVTYGLRYPQTITGPFHLAMFACSTQNYTQELVLDPIDLYANKNETVPPNLAERFTAAQQHQDQFSWAGASGRISFWIRGDTSVPSGTNVPAGNNYLFQYKCEATTSTGYVLGSVWIYIDNNRVFKVQMGNGTTGYATLDYGAPFQPPSDGAWHFYSVAWSYWDGNVVALRDGSTLGAGGYWETNGFIDYTNWNYNTDTELYAAGGKISNTVRTHLPISDVIIESGYEPYNDNFGSVWPIFPYPSASATGRPILSPIEAVAGFTPVNGWDTLAELARNCMAMYRADEGDDIEFLPLSYFGEAAQLAATTVADTEVNAGDLNVSYDPSHSRNVVTLNFIETKVDQGYSTCLALQSAVEILPGSSTLIFTLDLPVAEIHGSSAPHNPWWTLTNLTGAQVTAGTRPNNVHFMAVNTLADGSGTYQTTSQVSASILSYTQTTITLVFSNKTGKSAWLANNYQGDNQLPFMQILGYVVRESDGYVTERDSGSIGTRRERALSADMTWIHDRNTAQQLASHMVTALARPRAQVVVEVQGDPRRTPGQAVTVADAQDTQASGLWRTLAVGHKADGPQYTQTLQLVSVPPVGVWDGEPGWDEEIWSE